MKNLDPAQSKRSTHEVGASTTRSSVTAHAPAESNTLRMQRAIGNAGTPSAVKLRPSQSSGAPRQAPSQAGTKQTWTRLEQGEIGELMVENFLDKKGCEVFKDWDKQTNKFGIDIVAYDPATNFVLAIDNKAQKKTINNASALSVERLGTENLDGLIEALDKNTGYSEAARRAFHDRRVKFVLSNAHPGNLNTSFSAAVFERGWYALDIATGGIFSSLQDLRAARAALSGTALVGARAGTPPEAGAPGSGESGFATVGGLMFAIVSIGGIVYALKDIHTLRDLTDFIVGNIVTGGSSSPTAAV